MFEPFTISAARREIMQKLAGLFLWELPAEIPAEFVEYELLKNGMVGFFRYEGKPQAVRVSFTDIPDSYFIHRKFIYANPILGSDVLEDGRDAVIGYNEPMAKWTPQTTWVVICKYADLWNAADISLRTGVINTRLMFIGTADNQQAVQGYNDLIDAVWKGKPAFAVNSETLISEGLKVLPTASISSTYLQQIAECREYIINSCLNAFGVLVNTQAKRERLITTEIDLQVERPMFNIYTMLHEREILAEKLSEFYGQKVTVKLNPILNHYDPSEKSDMGNVTHENEKQEQEETPNADTESESPSESDDR